MRQILIFIFACVCSLNVFSQKVYNYTFDEWTETHYVGGNRILSKALVFSGEITDTVCISTKQVDNVKTTKIAKGRWEIKFSDRTCSSIAEFTVYDDNNKPVVWYIYRSKYDGCFINVSTMKTDDRPVKIYSVFTDLLMCSVAVSDTFGCIDITIYKDSETYYSQYTSYNSFVKKHYETNAETGITYLK